MLNILKRRKATEEAAETVTVDRVGARTLSNLLDERKSAKTVQEVEELCAMYGVSVEVSSVVESGAAQGRVRSDLSHSHCRPSTSSASMSTHLPSARSRSQQSRWKKTTARLNW